LTKSRFEEAYSEYRLRLLGTAEQRGYLNSRKNLGNVLDITRIGKSIEEHTKHYAEAKRRESYIKEIAAQKITRLTRKTLDPIIQNVSLKINDSKPPSWRTLCRWQKAYSIREDIRDLVPAHMNKGQKGTSLVPDVINVVRTSIESHYLVSPGKDVPFVHGIIVDAIDDINRFRVSGNKLSTPSLSTIYRIIRNIDPYVVMYYREGKKKADFWYSQSGLPQRPTRCLERVVFDDTKSDLVVIHDKTYIVLGRPWITCAIDEFTKMLVGVHVSFNAPSCVSAAKCLRNAILPKDGLRKRYPDIVHDWPSYGLIETAVLDNAFQNHSSDFERICDNTGIIAQYAPRETPWYKGSIERYFRTQNDQLLHNISGTTYSNVLERGDYNPSENAVVTLSCFLSMLYKWIVDVYHQNKHEGTVDLRFECPGIHTTPQIAWNRSVEEWEPLLLDDPKRLEMIFGKEETRTLHRYGIDYKNLRYNCPELATLRNRPDFDNEVTFKYDEDRIGIIYAIDKHNNRLIPVKAIAYEYARNLSLYQHTLIREFALRECDRTDEIALAKAKAYIARMGEEAIRNMGNAESKKNNVYLGRWEGMQSPPLYLSARDLDGDEKQVSKGEISGPPSVEGVRRRLADFTMCEPQGLESMEQSMEKDTPVSIGTNPPFEEETRKKPRKRTNKQEGIDSRDGVGGPAGETGPEYWEEQVEDYLIPKDSGFGIDRLTKRK
jgi:putative transposase